MFLSFYSELTQKYVSEYLLTMLEWTVACSMYLAMPVTKAFLSSKLVLKFGCKESKMQNLILGREKNFYIYCKYKHTLVLVVWVFFEKHILFFLTAMGNGKTHFPAMTTHLVKQR